MQNMSGVKTALGLDANVGALLCYLPVCGINLVYSILVIVQDKTNRIVRFHAFQSLFLLAASLVICIPLYILWFVGFFVDAMIGLPIFTALGGLVMLAVIIGLLYFVIMAMIKGYGGVMYKIPVIGNFAEKYSG
jgi:uncharacterized membrane protein